MKAINEVFEFPLTIERRSGGCYVVYTDNGLPLTKELTEQEAISIVFSLTYAERFGEAMEDFIINPKRVDFKYQVKLVLEEAKRFLEALLNGK